MQPSRTPWIEQRGVEGSVPAISHGVGEKPLEEEVLLKNSIYVFT